MFICLWLTTTSYISCIAQRVLPNAQFARKNLLRSKSLNYIARDKIRRITLYVNLCPVSTFRAWSLGSYDNVCLSIKNEGGENTATKKVGGEKENEIKVQKKDNVRRGCDEKSEAGRGET